MTRRSGATALALALLASACGSSSSSSSTSSTTSTTAPTTTVTTDTFSGTVPVKGRDVHAFTTSATGAVTVVLTAASPPATIVMGVGIGTPSGSNCPPLAGASVNTAAGGGPAPGILTAGSYCVVVSDVGNQTAPVAYTVTVNHP
ncbi:MAG: hypothetical protein LAO77_14265 [Acidobacteriia bacterium]|nr:hypothetical protein [Terriglobia bacterium]